MARERHIAVAWPPLTQRCNKIAIWDSRCWRFLDYASSIYAIISVTFFFARIANLFFRSRMLRREISFCSCWSFSRWSGIVSAPERKNAKCDILCPCFLIFSPFYSFQKSCVHVDPLYFCSLRSCCTNTSLFLLSLSLSLSLFLSLSLSLSIFFRDARRFDFVTLRFPCDY